MRVDVIRIVVGAFERIPKSLQEFENNGRIETIPTILISIRKALQPTIGRVTNCLDAHLGQIVYDKDGVVD